MSKAYSAAGAAAAAASAAGARVPSGKGGVVEKITDRLYDAYDLAAFRSYQRKERGDRFGRPFHNIGQFIQHYSWIWLGMCIAFTNYVALAQRGHREVVMANIEENRRRYYGKLFAQEYMAYAPTKLYDGPVGYMQVDNVTGLKVNSDGKITGPSGKELAERVNKTTITDEMVDAIAKLRDSQYVPGKDPTEKPDRKKFWTPFM
jgi:hypothetical protein